MSNVDHRPVPVNIRSDLLRYASRFTADRADPVAVTALALPLLEWLEGAADGQDMRARWLALDRQYANTAAERGGSVEGLLASAQTLHAFLAARPQPRTAAPYYAGPAE